MSEHDPVTETETRSENEPQSFGRWALETISFVVLALLIFVGSAVTVNSCMKADEVTPGEQLRDMVEDDNGRSTEKKTEQA
jgi:hypothetical protein